MRLRRCEVVMLSLWVLPIAAQSPQKLAEINQKVVGKWVSSDGKSYIEFRADRSCSAGALWPDGQWHIDQNTIGAWQQGNDFSCGSGALSLMEPNTLTRDYGMGGTPEVFHRVAAGATVAADRFVIHTPKGNVAVLDFRKHPAQVTQDHQTYVIADTDRFQIVFNVGDTSFAVIALTKPFPVVRKEGEAAFLKDLGISQGDACKLAAYEGTTIHVDPPYAGQSYGFSFCPGTPQPATAPASPKRQ